MTDIAIVGAGPAGVFASILLAQCGKFDVTVFDYKRPLTTLLPTGGGRCNLSYYEYDVKELVKNYPRGEKFLLSVFSKFGPLDMISLLSGWGIETYVQDDLRIFPKSDSSKVFAGELHSLARKYGVNFVSEKVLDVKPKGENYNIYTDKAQYHFSKCIFASGGKGNAFNIAEKLGHSVVTLKPALSSLVLKEKDYYELSGLSLKDTEISVFFEGKKIASATGDVLFTHKSLSGPAVFKISSLCTYFDCSLEKPLELRIKLINTSAEEIESFINSAISSHPNKTLKNVFQEMLPSRLFEIICRKNSIDIQKQITHISKNERKLINDSFLSLKLESTGTLAGDEIVTAGGINLNEINSATMESKIFKNMYFIGEMLDIDGFTGGFNLQNCWSTAFICSEAIKKGAI